MSLLYSPTSGDNQQEVENIQRIEKAIAQVLPAQVKLTVEGQSIPLPEAIYNLLLEALQVMAQGKAISLVPVSQKVTKAQAADILNISLSYLETLLDQGTIAYHQVENQRQLFLADVLTYKSQRDAVGKEGLQKLAEFSQEHGLYDLSYEPETE